MTTDRMIPGQLTVGPIELRQYTMRPGGRAELIRQFNSHLVAGQESVGMQVIGWFVDLDDPDRFVWLRGFESLDSRATALDTFYGGPLWQRYREQANATMVSSDDVLLLTALPGSSLGVTAAAAENPDDAGAYDPPTISVGIWSLEHVAPSDESVSAARLCATLRADGADVIATFTPYPEANNYPGLPVRDDRAVVVLTRTGFPAPLADQPDLPALQRIRLQPGDRSPQL